jgi:5-methyltetrahydrofolate--homocysteine methyltransferase
LDNFQQFRSTVSLTMNDRKLRNQALFDALETRVLVLDGAMGSILHSKLAVADYGGAHLENCTDNVCRVRPDLIGEIHRAYLDAGAELIETNSFNGHPISLAEFQLESEADEINRAAARLAREAADAYWSDAKPRFVAGSMGPTTRSITVTRNVTFPELRHGFYLQAKALIEGGADILLVETSQDTRNVKAALLGIEDAERELGFEVPIMVSGTIEPMGTMLAGQTADTFYVSIAHRKLLSVGQLEKIRRSRLAEHGRRLLRNHACTHPPSRRWSTARSREPSLAVQHRAYSAASNWSKPTTRTVR